MAPRAKESFQSFVSRLEQALDRGDCEVRFGTHHYNHAVCVEDGGFAVRRLEHTAEEAAAYLAEHGIFMPEHAAAISTPRTLAFEATSREALVEQLKKRWPF